MGQLIEGTWHAGWYDPDEDGRFQRPKTAFRHRIEARPSAPFPAEAGRYHLYAAAACPWAHRALLTRSLRGLEEAVSVTLVDPKMGDDGWAFTKADPDPHLGARLLREVYLAANARYTGRVTVPVLWDTKTRTIVCNESREVMRMLDVELDAFATGGPCLAPPDLRSAIDETLDAIYEPVNNGVYRAGFATSQAAYDEAVGELFEALERWEGVLSRQRYLLGRTLTEADLALFTTLVRFDVVYYAHFKCNRQRLADFPALFGFVRDLWRRPEVRRTCDLDAIKVHYYWSQTTVNPHRIVPIGPELDLDAPVDRSNLGA